MAEAADRDRDGQLAGVERDAIVASLLGISPDRLRTMRRLHHKHVTCGDTAGAPPSTERTRRWLRLDQLDDAALCAALRRRNALACGPERPAVSLHPGG